MTFASDLCAEASRLLGLSRRDVSRAAGLIGEGTFSCIVTQDGNCVVTHVDPDIGTFSKPSREEAIREIVRRKQAARRAA